MPESSVRAPRVVIPSYSPEPCTWLRDPSKPSAFVPHPSPRSCVYSPPRMASGYRLVRKIPGIPDCVNCLDFSRSGANLAIACDSGLLAVASSSTGKITLRLLGSSPVTSVLWHPFHDNVLIIGYHDGTVRLHTLGRAAVRVSSTPTSSPDKF